MQKTVDVKRATDPSLILPDRIKLNEQAYQVDVIDELKYPNLYYIQLSEDKRWSLGMTVKGLQGILSRN